MVKDGADTNYPAADDNSLLSHDLNDHDLNQDHSLTISPDQADSYFSRRRRVRPKSSFSLLSE